MSRLVGAWKRLWRTSPVASRVAFGTALASGIYYLLVLWWAVVAAAFNDSQTLAAERNVPVAAAVVVTVVGGLVGSLLQIAVFVGIQVAVGLALRAHSLALKWIGATAALLLSMVAVGLSLIAAPQGAVLVTAVWVVIAIVFLVVAVLGFIEAARSARPRAPVAS